MVSVELLNSSLAAYLQYRSYLATPYGYNNSLDGGDGIQRWTLRDGLAAE